MSDHELDLEGWYLHGEFDDWADEEEYWDERDDWELWEENCFDPCRDCGPHCPDWGGDGLCMLEIRALADEAWQKEHPIRFWIQDRWYGFTALLRYQLRRPKNWLLTVCPECKQPETIFGRPVGDHFDCLPF